MKKDVLLSLSGVQAETIQGEEVADEPIEIISPATYFFKDGLHYIFYEEVQEGCAELTKTKIVFKENEYLEVVKKGATHSHMKFQLDKHFETDYHTPYGDMVVGIITYGIVADIKETQIIVKASYELMINADPYANCEIIVKVTEA